MITANTTASFAGLPGRHREPERPPSCGGCVHESPILPPVLPRVLLVAIMAFCLPRAAAAKVILNAEVRFTLEDNVVGLLSGDRDAVGMHPSGGMQAPAQTAAGSVTGKGIGGGPGSPGGTGRYTGSGSRSPGDLSVSVLAETGGIIDAGDSFSFHAKGFAQRISYLEFSEYDQTAAGIVAGVAAFLGDRFSCGITAFESVRRYDNDRDRDNTSRGGTATVKRLLGRAFSFRGSVKYETSRAAYPDFSYRGTAVRGRIGYDATKKLLFLTGYGFQARKYRDSDRSVLRTGTASFGADRAFSRRWSSDLFYDRETTAAATTGMITRNNVLTFSIRYSY